jgi:hypothetical protein
MYIWGRLSVRPTGVSGGRKHAPSSGFPMQELHDGRHELRPQCDPVLQDYLCHWDRVWVAPPDHTDYPVNRTVTPAPQLMNSGGSDLRLGSAASAFSSWKLARYTRTEKHRLARSQTFEVLFSRSCQRGLRPSLTVRKNVYHRRLEHTSPF